ncbi:MAG TPA: hypothetical protein DCL77_12150, partial [Prolixibacteraceae bacterium]|nr:hypothetical protein [Prolixibacteraceae bacterium]
GMNTGLQDAHNLAWKLAFVIQGKASPKLLETYEAERRPLALRVIRYTDLAYSFMTTNFFFIRFLRLTIIPLLLPIFIIGFKYRSGLRRGIFMSISGIGIKYKHGLLAHSSNSFPILIPKPGERIPYLTFGMNGKQVSIYDCMGDSTFTLFILGKQLLPESFQQIINHYRHVVSVIHIEKQVGNQLLFKSLGFKNEGYYLVRPDHFIALRSQEFNAVDFDNYLQKFMK